MKQVALLSVGDRTRVCPLCDGTITGARCHPCRNTFPRPGTSSHRRWARGITAVVRRRLENAGLNALAPDACRALVIGDVTMPSEVAGLLADIATMPISVPAYQRAERWALDHHRGMREAAKDGIVGDEAAIFAEAFADALAERRGMPRLRIEVSTMLRVAAVTSEDSADEAEEAAREEEATDEAVAAYGPQRIARTL